MGLAMRRGRRSARSWARWLHGPGAGRSSIGPIGPRRTSTRSARSSSRSDPRAAPPAGSAQVASRRRSLGRRSPVVARRAQCADELDAIAHGNEPQPGDPLGSARLCTRRSSASASGPRGRRAARARGRARHARGDRRARGPGRGGGARSEAHLALREAAARWPRSSQTRALDVLRELSPRRPASCPRVVAELLAHTGASSARPRVERSLDPQLVCVPARRADRRLRDVRLTSGSPSSCSPRRRAVAASGSPQMRGRPSHHLARRPHRRVAERVWSPLISYLRSPSRSQRPRSSRSAGGRGPSLPCSLRAPPSGFRWPWPRRHHPPSSPTRAAPRLLPRMPRFH